MMRNSDVIMRMYNVDWGVSAVGFAARVKPREPQHNSTIQMMDKRQQKQVSMQSSVRFSGRFIQTRPDSKQWYLWIGSSKFGSD